jgi:NAD-dependent SIR2 family protein deacetylase
VIDRAARVIAEADYLLITAGAGMGVDSGLPDFRGNEGFWKAYPPYKKLGLNFMAMANPRSFTGDPALGWGFYGHRLGLYRRTVPHDGFAILRRWAQAKRGYFVFTSNVDGHFQRAGFDGDRVYEVHGSIHHLQCTEPCCEDVYAADDIDVAIDEQTMRARPPLPACRKCGRVARPNILMFGDSGYLDTRDREQRERYMDFLRAIDGTLAIVELGAGTAVPTVRLEGERQTRHRDVTLVRINPRETEVPDGGISIALGAREGVRAIEHAIASLG